MAPTEDMGAVPDWAKQRACDIINAADVAGYRHAPENQDWNRLWRGAFARYIAEHEIDPLLPIAREIVASTQHDPWPESPWHLEQAAVIRMGHGDRNLTVLAALHGLRRGIEIAKEQP